MKFKRLFILAVILAISCTCMAENEESEAVISAAEGWSWEAGATDILTGTINLSGFEQQDLTIQMRSSLPYAQGEDEKSRPVFVTVNGSRITMNKQSDTISFVPSSEDPFLRFSARFTLPEKQRVYDAVFQFVVKDYNGKELKTFSAGISGKEKATGNVFYISSDISEMTLIIGIAALCVWIAAVIRFLFYRKKGKQENHYYADL